MDVFASGKKLQEQARVNALKRLKLQFKTPDELNQLEQHLSKNHHKKLEIERIFKSAVHEYYSNISNCLEELKSAEKRITQLESALDVIQDEYESISHLEAAFKDLNFETNKYKQLAAAKQNLQNVLSVDDLIELAVDHLKENKLLEAHQCISEIDKYRDVILEEISSTGVDFNTLGDIKLVEKYFERAKPVQIELEKRIFNTINQMIDIAQNEPTRLVTALRIIEREEEYDSQLKVKMAKSGFLPYDRPKNWANLCKEQILHLFDSKIRNYGNENQEWFGRHLAAINTLIIEELILIKTKCTPCFPPKYKIFEYSVECIHNRLQSYFNSLFEEKKLRDREYLVLLTWLPRYKSEALMGKKELCINVDELTDLLDSSYYRIALNTHLNYVSSSLYKWLRTILEKDFLIQITPPIVVCDSKTKTNYYRSNLANDLNELIRQQIELGFTLDDDILSEETIKLILTHLNTFCDNLKEEINKLNMGEHGVDFVTRIVTVANDCILLKENLFMIRDEKDKFLDKKESSGSNDQYEIIANKLFSIIDLSMDCICNDMRKSLDEKYFKNLLNKEWLQNDSIISDIIATTSDYLNEVNYLKKKLRINLLIKWHNRIKAEYMKGLLQNHNRMFSKYQLTDLSERKLFTYKLKKEISLIRDWFNQMSEKKFFSFEIVDLMNNVIRADDEDTTLIEVAALTKYMPISMPILSALLTLKSQNAKDFEDYCSDEPVEDEAMFIVINELKIK